MNPTVFYRRCILLCLVFVAGLSGLSARLIYLHVIKAKDYAKKSDRVSIRKQTLKANRGCIVDCNDQLIARNIPRARMTLDKKLLRDISLATLSLANKELRESSEWYQWDQRTRNSKIKARAAKLKNEMQADEIIEKHLDHVVDTFARPLGMTPNELRQRMKLDRKGQIVIIKPDLSEDDAEKLKQLARDYSILHTFVFEELQKRWYVMPEMAAAIIGYVGEDKEGERGAIKGRSGIEYMMEKLMSGRDGFIVTHRDKFELLAIAKPQKMQPPAHGLNIQLTLDMGMQKILEQELEAGLAEFQAEKGTIILMNPNSGSILGMASRPTYNLNTRENIAENGFDYATQAIYEPGSTFKIISTAGAVDQGLVQPDTAFFCGPYRKGPLRVRDYKTFSNLTVQEILAKSSNVGSYKVALELGPEKYFKYLRNFGFGAKTNVLMSGESAGVIQNTGNAVDFSRVTYGYAVSVTPLQVACAYSAIANGGLLMEPQLLKSVMANNGSIVQRFKPVPIRRVIKQETAQKMREMLATVVDIKGTARRAKVEGFQAAGKTGTTQKIHPAGGYYDGKNDREKRYTVSFAGMLPADKPEFVCVVVIDHPTMPDPEEGKERADPGGGSVAAPIFSRVATRVIKLMGMEPKELANSTSDGEQLAKKTH